VGATLVVVLVLWCARLTDNWFSGGTPTPPESSRAQSTANPSPSPQSLEKFKAAAGRDAVLPRTPQRLFLVSTSPGRSIGEGTARIGTDPEHPQTYVAGALLANGAQLTEIHPTYVVLERDGKKAELHLKGGKRDSELAMLGGPPPVPSTKEVTTVDDRLSGVIRSMPVYQGDVLVGLEVYAGRNAGIFQQLGLRSGDIIVALDGAPVADPSDSLNLLRTLADGVAITATVRRQNTTTTVALDGTLLAATTQPPTAPLTGAMSQ
jgi:hypothetical protein